MNIRKNITIKILGMTCASCAMSNEKELLKTKGILNATVNFASKKAYVEYDADVLGEEDVKKVIMDNGYQIEGITGIQTRITNANMDPAP